MKLLMGFCGRGLAKVLRLLPRWALRSLGAALGIFWFDALRIRRQVIIDNLAIAFPEKTRSERIQMGRKFLCEFGHNLMEYAYLQDLSRQKWDEFFVAEGFENLSEALNQGRGVLLLTLHLGNYDLALAGLALVPYPIAVVSKEFKTRWLNELWFGMRKRCGIKFIPPRNSSYAALKALKRNEVVVFVLDQFTGPPIGVKTRFFGRETGTGLGLAMMAHRSKAPVLPAYTYRRDDGRHQVVIQPPIQFSVSLDRDEALAQTTQAYNDHLEQLVRQHPTQWMWLHKRWKQFKV